MTGGGPRVRIAGIGKAVPERVVPNEEIAAHLGVDPSWIEVRTGIQQRRYAGPDESPSTLGAAAAREALAVAGVGADDVDLLVVATCTPDHVFPHTSSLLQDLIGARRAGAFDVGAACSGFVYALGVAGSMLTSGGARRALVVGTETLSRYIDFQDPITAPLFGDGAGAVVLEPDESAEEIRFDLGADGSGAAFVHIPAGGTRMPATAETLDKRLHFIQMAGREVYRSAVRAMTNLGETLGKDGFDLLIAHQANRRILMECASNLGADPEKVFMNIDRYGNTSAASIPIAMCEAWETGRLRPGHRLLLLAFGAGYTWAGATVPWTLPGPSAADDVRILSREIAETAAAPGAQR